MGWKKWLGIGLIGLSGVWFAAMILIPFTSLSLELKGLFVLIFLILMEASFWLGTIIIGKQVVSKFWNRLRKESLSKDSYAYQTIIKVEDGAETQIGQYSTELSIGHESKSFIILMENVPYAIMILLGMTVFLFGLDFSSTAWVLAALYGLYAVIGVMWIIVFVCPFCHNFGSGCFSGHGQISAKFMKKKDEGKFREEFKRNIPVIILIYIIPVICGVAFLFLSFSVVVLIFVALFALNTFVLSPRISMKYACSRCSIRKDCPWMGEGSLFSKGGSEKKR
jgi:hypothetical protein